MQSKHNQSCGLGDIAVSEFKLQLDATAAEERYSVFWCNVGDAGKHAVADFMADVCQTGKVVALTQLADNRVFLMVKAGAQTGDLSASLDHEQMVPIKTHWDELDDYIALRLLFNSCSQFEGIEDEIPNDTGHLYIISAKGARRDAVEKAGTGPAKIETVETVINEDCTFELKIRTFTKRRVLIGRAAGDELELKKINSQVGYRLSPVATVVLAHGQSDEYILRRAKGDKPSKRRDLTFSAQAEKVAYTKKGILYRELQILERRYSDFAQVSLREYPRKSFYEVLKSDRYARVVAARSVGQRVVVSFASDGLDRVARQLVDRLNDSSWGVRASYGGGAVDQLAWNIVMVPNGVAEDDGYALHVGVVEQHVTPDVCEPLVKAASKAKVRGAQEGVLGAMLKELLVKQDVVDGRMQAFDLGSFGVESVTACGVVNVPRKEKDKIELDAHLAALTIGADGDMDYTSHPIEDGPVDEMELELLTADGKLDKDAYIFDVQAGGQSMLARVRDMGLTTFSNNFATLMRDYQLTGKAGRKKEFFESYNSPYYGIGTFERAGLTCYFVGINNGTKEDLATAIHVRSIEVLEGDDLSELLVQLVNVGLSRHGAPSRWPIPVKYLNEYAAREGAAGECGICS
ncbi:hypothetical protein [Collinsella aerofaciens]|uniref:hypothetical protein n=1 Tax=Collinsella aerofaciens TaxID=74426 RepID=UPI003D7B9310